MPSSIRNKLSKVITTWSTFSNFSSSFSIFSSFTSTCSGSLVSLVCITSSSSPSSLPLWPLFISLLMFSFPGCYPAPLKQCGQSLVIAYLHLFFHFLSLNLNKAITSTYNYVCVLLWSKSWIMSRVHMYNH